VDLIYFDSHHHSINHSLTHSINHSIITCNITPNNNDTNLFHYFFCSAAVIKAIHHQLKSSDPKVVQLALTLTDTCVQNSWTHVPQAIYKGFMDEIGQICRGRRGVQNQEEALRLVQVWGRRFEQKRSELPIFFDTYMSMRAQGADFPPEEAPAPTSSTSHG
jgi:hypothetical protein